MFGRKVSVGGAYLDDYWGSKGPQRYVSRETRFTGKKWKDLFLKAEIWAENEVDKLVEVIEKRKLALDNAED